MYQRKSQLIDGVEGIICDLNVEGISNTLEKLIENKEQRDRLIENLNKFDYSNTEELNKLYQLIC